jgi:hypothetical protein
MIVQNFRGRANGERLICKVENGPLKHCNANIKYQKYQAANCLFLEITQPLKNNP